MAEHRVHKAEDSDPNQDIDAATSTVETAGILMTHPHQAYTWGCCVKTSSVTAGPKGVHAPRRHVCCTYACLWNSVIPLNSLPVGVNTIEISTVTGKHGHSGCTSVFWIIFTHFNPSDSLKFYSIINWSL